MKRRYAIGGVLVACLVAAALYLYGGNRTPSDQPPLHNLTAVADLTHAFNAAKGDVRVLLLLSPT